MLFSRFKNRKTLLLTINTLTPALQKWVRSRFVPGVALIPEDFGHRLTLLKERARLSWEGLATCIGVDHRQLLRWRKKGAEPPGGAMLALVALAEQVPGGLDILMGRDLGVMAQGRE